MIPRIPLLCRVGLHKLVRRYHPSNWRACTRCGHVIFDKGEQK